MKLINNRINRGTERRFFKEAGRIGLVMLAFAAPFDAKAEGTGTPTEAPRVQEVGHYPNFSGAGVHGNPAIWSAYGNWGYTELSGSPSQENSSLSAILSSRLAGDAHGLLKLNVAGDMDSSTMSALGVLSLTLPYTLRAGAGIGVDTQGRAAAQAGIASVYSRGRFLLRNGLYYDLPSGQISFASEARGAIGDFELTGSANASVSARDGGGYAGQAVGAQLRYRSHLLSFGCGGQEIGEWDIFRLHYRLWMDSDTSIDLHLRGKSEGLFRNPDFIGIGITRMF